MNINENQPIPVATMLVGAAVGRWIATIAVDSIEDERTADRWIRRGEIMGGIAGLTVPILRHLGQLHRAYRLVP